MSRWILAAIDGSGSTEWRLPDGSNSHISNFQRSFRIEGGGSKAYFDGPTTSGFNSHTILTNARRFIFNSLKELIPELQHLTSYELVENPNSHIRDILRSSDIEFCLMGHSRGGSIATVIARHLPKRVRFLGLLDSVDRAYSLVDTDEIINVEFTAHAIRDPRSGSRCYFGNTSLRSRGGQYTSRIFMTSHGGMGGSYILYPDSNLLSDDTCLIPIPRSGTGTMVRRTGSMSDLCTRESQNVYNWMIMNARTHGLPI